MNVHDRTLQSRHRLRPANGKQDSLRITAFEQAAPWWSLDRWINWENLTVAGREVKGFVVKPFVAGLITTVAGVLLAASITITFAVYSGMSNRIQQQNEAHSRALQEQRDLLIRLDQRLIDKSDRDQEYRRETKDKFDSIDAWQGVTNKNIEQIRASR